MADMSFRHPVLLPNRRVPPPGTGFRWTSSLIARDTRLIYRDMKAGLSKKFKAFKASKEPGHDTPFVKAIILKTSRKGTSHASSNPSAANPTPPEKGSVSTKYSSLKPSVFDSRPNTSETQTTEADQVDESPPDAFEMPPALIGTTFYEFLENKMILWYKNRPIDLPLEERYMTRGMALFMRIALECCNLSPIYRNVGIYQLDPDGVEFIKGVKHYASIKGGESISEALGLKLAGGEDSNQEVAVQSSVSPACWLTEKNGGQLETAGYWAALVVAVTDISSTSSVVHALIRETLPEVDVKSFLLRIGDASRRLEEDEDQLLLTKMRPFLFPEYARIWK